MNQGSKDIRWHEMTTTEIQFVVDSIAADRDKWQQVAEQQHQAIIASIAAPVRPKIIVDALESYSKAVRGG